MNTFPLVNGAALVADEKRQNFLPNLAKGNPMLTLYLENAIYNKAHELSPAYQGGYWEFVQIADGVGFMYPVTDKPINVVCFNGELETDAVTFGIACTMFACNALAWNFYNKDEKLARTANNLYFALRNWLHCDETYEMVKEALGTDEHPKQYQDIFKILD